MIHVGIKQNILQERDNIGPAMHIPHPIPIEKNNACGP